MLIILTFFCMLFLLSGCSSNMENNSLIYKQCTNQTSLNDSNAFALLLSTLFQELVDEAGKSKFYQTSVGDEEVAVSGLFQCRGDLSSDECHNCVDKFSEVSKTSCGNVVPARIQLSGCYLRYHPEGDETMSRLQLLHKTCGKSHSEIVGFEEIRNSAFAALESGIRSSENGFCDMKYEGVKLRAQCVGNLGACECGKCVNNALQIAQEECGYAGSGEVYLDSCFISYKYYHDGINGDMYEDKQHGNSNKLVAIVVGGIVALILAAAFYQFMRSCGKKKDGM
ncbi:hypothetical protein LIER_01578 [Lithospermum erythrorhizon]|uniref:Gnk2-homologous domain-containing protein n=1 Tax=Lithospermum erythrorhizon TaxID=34254 RepID=A0AAV3NLW7_LITER